ncbi:HAD family phosphatase [Candidatus Sumerlaeota bacterium]|nr:HAD family phosphatase [Candidatus Sumerlaeota bacterium]
MTGWGVIFDCDGVLVDSEALSDEAFADTLKRFAGGVELAREDWEMICGTTDADCVNYVSRRFQTPIDCRAFKEYKAARYQELAKERGLPLFEGVLDLLDGLDAIDAPYAVASSGSPEKIRINLEFNAIAHRFRATVSGEEFERGKPDPALFLAAAARIGLPPECCAVIEDSQNGIRAAKAAGMACLAVANSFESRQLATADRVVRSLAEVSALELRALIEGAHAQINDHREQPLRR